jgi:hypothetical protein
MHLADDRGVYSDVSEQSRSHINFCRDAGDGIDELTSRELLSPIGMG